MPNFIHAQPEITTLSTDAPHYALYKRVRDTLFTLPSFFQTELNISGVLATDLHKVGPLLGATIETQLVKTLNELRSNWDPERRYTAYTFIRQPQTFPDVILKTSVTDMMPKIIMGIELKSWYVLANEKEPSFSYKVTPGVCSSMDLLAVYPWALSNVIAGTPITFQPFVTSALYAAEYRNWHWQYQKAGGERNLLQLSEATAHYPIKSDLICDVAVNDKGNNFGRFARTGLMDEYINDIFSEQLSGIAVADWQRFLSSVQRI